MAAGACGVPPTEEPATAPPPGIAVADASGLARPSRQTTVPATRTVTAVFTGDTLLHSPLWDLARQYAGGAGYDFAPMFQDIRPLVERADLAVCHLETPVAPVGRPLSTFPVYAVPAEIATALAGAGYDRCSTASNHTLDQGLAGIDRTVEVLTAAGLGQSGMARTLDELVPGPFEVAGVPVAHLSYTYGYNGFTFPRGEEWRSTLIDPARIVADARDVRSRGARVVIVSLHWGNEGESAITGEQRRAAEAITASGEVDLIVGHHAHVLQPIEQVNGTWVVYGLSNILSNLHSGGTKWPDSVQDGAIAEVSFTVGADGSVSVSRPVVHPTWVDRFGGWVVRPVLEALADPATPGSIRGALEDSLDRTRAVLGDHLPG